MVNFFFLIERQAAQRFEAIFYFFAGELFEFRGHLLPEYQGGDFGI